MSRFVISNLRLGPEDLREQLPVVGATVDVRTGPDGQGYFYSRLDNPIKHRIDTDFDTASCSPELLGSDHDGHFLWVSDIVIRPSIPGEQPHFGMRRFPVDIAYVIDLSLLDDPDIDFGKLLPVASAEIDDLPDQTPAEPPPPPAAEVSSPPDSPTQERTAPAAAATPTQTGATTSAPRSISPEQLAEPRRLPTPEPARPGGRAATSRSTSETLPARPPRPRPTEASAPVASRPGPDVGPYPTRPAPPPRSSSPAHVFTATPSGQRPPKKVLAVSAVVLVGVLLIAVAVWSLLTSDDSAGTQAAPIPTQSSADVQRVKPLVPKGYLDADCTATPGTDRPSMTCSSNADPGGPQSATYAIYPDRQSLQEAFSATTATFDRMVCPGNIQSPGPWRRNAAPAQVAGTLFCGTTQRGQAVVVWTSEAQSLLNVAQAGAQGPSLAQLYTWWTFHS